jgi:hypothetical protein
MWNPKRAAFHLIAVVILVEIFLVVVSFSLCAWMGIHGVKPTEACEDGRFSRIIADALVVCLALYQYNNSDKQ